MESEEQTRFSVMPCKVVQRFQLINAERQGTDESGGLFLQRRNRELLGAGANLSARDHKGRNDLR